MKLCIPTCFSLCEIIQGGRKNVVLTGHHRILLTATVVALERQGQSPQGPLGGWGRGGLPKRKDESQLRCQLKQNQCAFSREEGHWKRGCPKLKSAIIAKVDQQEPGESTLVQWL